MSRGFKISRDYYTASEGGDRVDWIDDFANRLNKASQIKYPSAVEVGRQRAATNNSIFDQISSIMGGKPVYSSVQNAVEDMQRRTGLTEYLKRISSKEKGELEKSAHEPKGGGLAVCVFSDDESIKEKIINYIENIIETHNGHIAVPAVQSEVLDTFRGKCQPEHVNNPLAAKLISEKISSILSRNPQPSDPNLGRGVGLDIEVDQANTDFLAQFQPHKI